MADFCNQCAKELGFPEGDLANSLVGPPPFEMGYPVLCEGCGPILVDEKGNCIDPRCDRFHGTQAKAKEIHTAFMAECEKSETKILLVQNMGQACVILERIATELCGTWYAFDIQQLHDEYTVIVRPNV